ncbi:MAG: PAS domain-containing sensor histidine kinase [Marinilabiliaceae bacterium]|nr:PAS domain-containing sensor histidine kinase [Marinilabiliaceae bacterium]
MRILRPLLQLKGEQSNKKKVAKNPDQSTLNKQFVHAIVNKQGLLDEMSQSFINLSGYRKNYLKGGSVNRVLTSSSAQRIRQVICHLSDSHSYTSCEITFITKAGEHIKLEALCYFLKERSTERIFLILKNNDPEKQIVDDLFTQKEHFRIVAENTAYVQILLDNNSNCLFISPSARSLSGYPIKAIKNQNLYGLVHPEDINPLWEVLNNSDIIEKQSLQFRIKHEHGHFIPVECHIHKIYGDFGSPDYFVLNLHDISQQKQHEQDLIRARKKAEISNEIKNNFLTSVTHELRTPLNAIIGFSRVLDQKQFDPEAMKQIEAIESNGLQLLGLIDNILDFTCLNASYYKITQAEIDLDAFFRKLAPKVRSDQKKFNKENLEIIAEWKIDDLYPTITSDNQLLLKIFVNLLDNAIKFTRKGFVKYGCRPYGVHQYMFFVEDSGIGIPDDYQDIIFEKFRQMDQSMSREFGGMGIGLTVTKQMVELLSGEIWVKSENGKGSSFYFTLPITSRNTLSSAH